jgi:hypothetical protein
VNCFQALAGIPPVTERAKELLEDNGNSVAGAVRSVVVGGQEESGIDMVRKQAICLKVLLLLFSFFLSLFITKQPKTDCSNLLAPNCVTFT